MALVADARGALARAVARQRVEPIENCAVAPVPFDQSAQRITADAPALRALDDTPLASLSGS